mgnify:CR=1 FL=1
MVKLAVVGVAGRMGKTLVEAISQVSEASLSAGIDHPDINLIGTDNWIDLITRQEIALSSSFLQMKPYQTLWISNQDFE